jgi:membrane associated rhomboid family serine protease
MNQRHTFNLNCLQILIVLNALIFFLAPPSPSVSWLFALSADGMSSFKLWQIVSYQFLHGNFIHLAFNMWGLYLFGSHVLRRMGTQRFLTLYFLSGISGGMLWLLFNWNSRIPVIGASGAVFGVMMAAALYFPDMQMMLLFPPIPMKLRTLVLLFGAIEIFNELSAQQSGVAHLAHLGGFLAAYFYMRMSSGETFSEIFKHPLAAFKSSGSRSVSDRRVYRRQSEVNRKTFETIMSEIEELERENTRAMDEMDLDDKEE